MTHYQRIAVFLSLALGASFSAHADDNSTGRWTAADVSTLCHSRFGADDRSHGYQACVTRNKGKIGHDETPGEIQELNAAKAAGDSQ